MEVSHLSEMSCLILAHSRFAEIDPNGVPHCAMSVKWLMNHRFSTTNDLDDANLYVDKNSKGLHISLATILDDSDDGGKMYQRIVV